MFNSEITPSEQTLELRQILREAQKKWLANSDSPIAKTFFKIIDELKNIAGNEVFSNVFFGGFRKAIESTKHPFDSYKAEDIHHHLLVLQTNGQIQMIENRKKPYSMEKSIIGII